VTAAGDEAWAEFAELFLSDGNHARFTTACDAIDVGPPALKMLLGMEPGVGTRMRDFADKMRCDASWVTSLVDDLEAKGYVERRVHPTDRRVKTIFLTKNGMAAQARARAVLHKAPPGMTALTASEQRTLRDLVRKLRVASEVTGRSDVAG